jgi:hypothetical protein
LLSLVQTAPSWLNDIVQLVLLSWIFEHTQSWRRPGANISDWFNYGFDEISWETYCMTRKKLSETAAGLKANALVSSPCHLNSIATSLSI